MPITAESIQFDDGQDGVRLVLTGELSPDGALQVLSSALQSARVRSVDTVLVDLTRAYLTRRPSVIDCHYAGGFLARAGARLAKAAFVVRVECVTELAFLFTVAANRGLRATLFSNEHDALAWLGSSA